MSEQRRRIGYLRTSPTDQNPGIQADALKYAGRTEIYRATGPLTTQTARWKLLEPLNNGDELLVYRLDRLCRDEHSLVNLQQQLEAMSVTPVVTAEGGDHAQ